MNIFDKYGIKEVADVTFYEIKADGTEVPALYLDTLKVSTIEQTASEVEARGGKGNPALIAWDFNKEIDLVMEDALFSAKSMTMLYANDKAVTVSDADSVVEIYKNEFVVSGADGVVKLRYGLPDTIKNPYARKTEDGELTPVIIDSDKIKIGSEPNVEYQIFYVLMEVKPGKAFQIDINAGTFPGTYKIVGDTFARSQKYGGDENFQFIIPRAKMQSEVTLTMEAEGDPSVFNMQMKVLRPDRGPMMKLVKYNLDEIVG